jgi:hypothetical protein
MLVVVLKTVFDNCVDLYVAELLRLAHSVKVLSLKYIVR